MKLLLDEYKRTAKQTRKMKEILDDAAEHCEAEIEEVVKEFSVIKKMKNETSDASVDELEGRYGELRAKERELKIEREIVNSMVSSLSYSIHCIRYNVEPINTRGIERRAYYEREIPFENHWIERRKDEDASNSISFHVIEESEDEKYEQEIRRELVKEIKKCLTPRQIEVMELVGMDFTPRDIAEMLDISKRAVNYTIESARKKVKDEGWRMV